MGGRPRDTQIDLFQHCTHAILLLREDQPADTFMWQHFIQENGVIPLAQLYSMLAGETQVTKQSPILEGTITGLERHRLDRIHGPAFDQLCRARRHIVEFRIPRRIWNVSTLKRAPGDLINLSTFIAPATRWQPEMMPFFLTQLPTDTPLALYVAAPTWVYAAVAAATYQQALIPN